MAKEVIDAANVSLYQESSSHGHVIVMASAPEDPNSGLANGVRLFGEIDDLTLHVGGGGDPTIHLIGPTLSSRISAMLPQGSISDPGSRAWVALNTPDHQFHSVLRDNDKTYSSNDLPFPVPDDYSETPPMFKISADPSTKKSLVTADILAGDVRSSAYVSPDVLLYDAEKKGRGSKNITAEVRDRLPKVSVGKSLMSGGHEIHTSGNIDFRTVDDVVYENGETVRVSVPPYPVLEYGSSLSLFANSLAVKAMPDKAQIQIVDKVSQDDRRIIAHDGSILGFAQLIEKYGVASSVVVDILKEEQGRAYCLDINFFEATKRLRAAPIISLTSLHVDYDRDVSNPADYVTDCSTGFYSYVRNKYSGVNDLRIGRLSQPSWSNYMSTPKGLESFGESADGTHNFSLQLPNLASQPILFSFDSSGIAFMKGSEKVSTFFGIGSRFSSHPNFNRGSENRSVGQNIWVEERSHDMRSIQGLDLGMDIGSFFVSPVRVLDLLLTKNGIDLVHASGALSQVKGLQKEVSSNYSFSDITRYSGISGAHSYQPLVSF